MLWPVVVLGTGVSLVAARSALLVVTVHGISMLPGYRDGDRVLVLRRPWHRALYGRPLRRGDVVVCRAPGVPVSDLRRVLPEDFVPAGHGQAVEVDEKALPLHGLLVKRVAATGGDPYPDGSGTVPAGHVHVLGTAPVSFDSRDFGPIAESRVVGVVLRVIGP